MELKGRLLDIVRDLRTDEFRLTLGVVSIPSGIDALQDKDLAISLKKWSGKRSMTANAYYWVLVSKIAKATGHSIPRTHNWLLRQYGQLEIIDGSPVMVMLLDTEETELAVDEAETFHYKPTGHLERSKDGRLFRAHLVIKGSSRYDSVEMAQLINGTVDEARELDIETLPPDELGRMMKAYEEHYSERVG